MFLECFFYYLFLSVQLMIKTRNWGVDTSQ